MNYTPFQNSMQYFVYITLCLFVLLLLGKIPLNPQLLSIQLLVQFHSYMWARSWYTLLLDRVECTVKILINCPLISNFFDSLCDVTVHCLFFIGNTMASAQRNRPLEFHLHCNALIEMPCSHMNVLWVFQTLLY